MIRLTMTQIRVALLGGNLALTVLLGYLVASRFMAPTEGVRAAEAVKLMRKDPDECRASKTSHGTSKGLERRVSGLGGAFRKERPPPEPTGQETIEDVSTDEVPVPEAEALEPGPLEEKWEYTGGIYTSYYSQHNRATLQAKDSRTGAKGKKSTSSGRRKVSSRKTRTRASRSKVRRAGRTTGPVSKLLKLHERWVVDEEEGPVVFVLRITPDEFIYQEQGNYSTNYSLKRKRDDIWADRGEDILITPKKDEDEDAEDGEDDEEKKNHFYLLTTPPTVRDVFDERKKKFPEKFLPSKKTRTLSRTSTAGRRMSSRSSSSRRGTVRKPSAKETKSLEDTVKQLPLGARNKINQALKKGFKKSK